MNSEPRLRHRLSARIGVFIAVLLFSATAVEVAPQAIDVLQDLGWLAPDAVEAPAEAAALPRPDETLVTTSAIEPVITVDDEAYDRLMRFSASQPAALTEEVVYAGATDVADAADQADVAGLLEGVVSSDMGQANPMMFAPMNRSSEGGSMASSGWSGSTSANAGTAATTNAEASSDGPPATMANEAVTDEPPVAGQPQPSGTGRELYLVLADRPTTDTLNDANTTAPESISSPIVGLTLAPPPEIGTDAGASLEPSLVQNPEPATLLMLGAGLLFLARYGRRKTTT